jgi:Fur family transcriptional regulator, zinc uptake regulator
VAEALDRAALRCGASGAKLTDLRRQVLGLILDSPRPVGAYELLDRLREHRRGAAPPTVYRALDFLLEQGLIHRVERLSAFVACPVHDHAAHAAQFLICGGCGAVTELDDHGLQHSLVDAAARHGFRVHTATIEADGLCAACAAA